MNVILYDRASLAQVYLPVAEMLQIDRVISISETEVRCEMDLTRHWVFPMHFPGDAIFPACLMIEAAGQAIAIWAWHHQMKGKPRLARVQASFESAARPEDEMLSFHGKIKRRRNICIGTVKLFAGNRLVAEISETLAVV